MINNSFLYRIAEIYYKQYGSDISRFSFVFPNRRAGLFFRRYLTSIIDKNIFSPEILSINDCFSAASEWQTADRLSGGERKLLSLAMVLANKPKILLYDEPLAGLSSQNIETVLRWLNHLKQNGTTLVLIEHRIKELIGFLLDRSITKAEG